MGREAIVVVIKIQMWVPEECVPLRTMQGHLNKALVSAPALSSGPNSTSEIPVPIPEGAFSNAQRALGLGLGGVE